jgi:hypothetical protein
MKTSECKRLDDPQAPFGPELLCPLCESLAVPKYHPTLKFILTLLAAGAGFLAGSFLAGL